MRWQSVAISGACGLVGFLIATAISVAIPNTYISDVVLRVPDADNFQRQVLSRTTLADIIEKHRLYTDERGKKSIDQLVDAMLAKDLRIRKVGPTLHISFTSKEPFLAQSVILDLLQRYTQPLEMEVLDAPSLPQLPIYPNRYVIALLGLSLGLVSGAVFARVQRPVVA